MVYIIRLGHHLCPALRFSYLQDKWRLDVCSRFTLAVFVVCVRCIAGDASTFLGAFRLTFFRACSFHRILVMSDGMVVEYGPVGRLLSDQNSLFNALARNAGVVTRRQTGSALVRTEL